YSNFNFEFSPPVVYLIQPKPTLCLMTKQFFFYRDSGFLRRILIEEILYIEVTGNYVKFYALNYSHMVRTSLDAALAQLPETLFVQIHRSFAVALDHLDTIGRDFVSLKS